MKSANFLKNKYELQNAPETKVAALRTQKKTGEKVPQDPDAQIQNYLNRFKNILDCKIILDDNEQRRGLRHLKRVLRDKFVTKYEKIPDSYWLSQERIMRERGQLGDWHNASKEAKEQAKHQLAEALLNDQEASLEEWIYYLASAESKYIPDYLKYWVFRSVVNLQEYDKDNKEFRKRTNGDVKQFPDLNHEALAYLIDSILKKHQGHSPDWNYDIQPEERERFQQYLKQENFAKLYGWAVEQINPVSEHLLKETKGKWIKYSQGSDHKALYTSIQAKGTGWCTAGENTARQQLDGGDFYIYYTLDEENKPTIPRIAIRMEGDKIAEVRGIAYKQNLDPYMSGVLEKKLQEFPDKDIYLKKEHNMAFLTAIDRKMQKKEALNKGELFFLYEIDEKIQGFGYETDPRIKELLEQRDVKKDMLVIFECSNDQIAYDIKEIDENTKAYIGKWGVDVFQKIRNYPNIKYLFESFPDNKIFKQTLETDPRINSPKIAEELLIKQNIYLSEWGKDILYKTNFSKEKQKYNLVRFTVKQLGLSHGATTDEIYKRAQELELELCRAEVGSHLRLQYSGNEWMFIAMEQISDRNGAPGVFYLDSYGGRLGLDGSSAQPGDKWLDDGKFVFCFRKNEF